MPIEKGEAWGEPGPLAPDGVVVRSDAEARHVIERARRDHAPLPELGLLGGDLCRTVGGRGDEDRLHTDAATRLTIDLGSVLLDGRQHWFIAHLIARRSWLRGPLVAAMNAEWLGDWDVAPRAHPNDGLLDVVEADPPLADRWRARRRLPSGAHLPHPDIRLERTRARQLDLARPLDVWLDGEKVGSASAISLRVEPDALRVVV